MCVSDFFFVIDGLRHGCVMAPIGAVTSHGIDCKDASDSSKTGGREYQQV